MKPIFKVLTRRTIPVAIGAFLLFGCQQQDDVLEQELAPSIINSSELDALIWKNMEAKGEFDWQDTSDEVIWSALEQSDHILSVGFKPVKEQTDIRNTIDKIDIRSGDWKDARESVLEMIFKEERKLNSELKEDELIAFEENTLPVVDVYIKNFNTLRLLRKSKLVRYAEPMGYEPRNANRALNKIESAGCSNDPEGGLVQNLDFTNITPNAKASWNHPFHNIASAWNTSTGSGVKVMVIDTGMSDAQDNFGSQFNQGASQGRSIEKLVTLPRRTIFGFPVGSPETSDDGCGHGTAMAGLLAAPRGVDGNVAGVAYNADLVTVRATSDVLLDESREIKGVSDACIIAGDRSDIRIISMSLGRITSNSRLRDAVRYAFNRDVLIFSAGGTSIGFTASFWGVIFPATMEETVAVTGVKDTPNLRRCNICHEGRLIDFAIVMERDAGNVGPITTAMMGDQPSRSGGSSAATAQTAGIAALVWSANPNLSRDQVLNRLKVTASNYPNRDNNFGWGLVDAAAALNVQ